MINVDRVYQTVNSLLNRHAIDTLSGPEFNLLATKAQIDVFEGEFYDLKNALAQGIGMGSDWGDIADNIRDKIQIFETQDSLVVSSTPGLYNFPDNYYRLTVLLWYDELGDAFPRAIEEVIHSRIPFLVRSPLTTPTVTSPIYAWSDNQAAIYPTPVDPVVIAASYIRTPNDPSWVSAANATDFTVEYDETNSVDFEVHASNLPELIIHILAYAGLELSRPDVVNFAQGEDAKIQNAEQ